MNQSEIKKAIKLLEEYIQRHSTCANDNGGRILEVEWIGGGQKNFYSIDEVEAWIYHRNQS
jgi:hypothetical protein